MATDSTLRHYPDIILNHSLAKKGFASNLCVLSERDCPRKGYFASVEIPALDMDSYECSRPGNNDKTCDAVIGVCDRRNNHIYRERLMLAELRMNYDNISNLSTTELIGKEKHTRDLLIDAGDCCVIDMHFCLVFKPVRESEARSRVSRLKTENSGIDHWEAFSPDSFCNFIGYGVKDPYEPDQQTSDIVKRLADAAVSSDIGKIETEWNRARQHLTSCSQRYELEACRYMAENIKNALDNFKSDNFKDDELLELEILQEDIITAIRRHLPAD